MENKKVIESIDTIINAAEIHRNKEDVKLNKKSFYNRNEIVKRARKYLEELEQDGKGNGILAKEIRQSLQTLINYYANNSK